jgi:uncharacterized phage protein (TIGR02220 family)
MTDQETIRKTIEYLNSKVATDYTPDFKPTVDSLQSLIKMGYALADFKTVIDKKWEQWKGTKFEMYIRPSTLFGKNFENYLNEPRNPKTSTIQKLVNSVQSAKQHSWRLDTK